MFPVPDNNILWFDWTDISTVVETGGNIESISNKDELWITKQDEIDYDILEEECIENDIRYDIDASWTAFRGEHFDGGAFWKINISIPIIHILYRPYGWKKIFTDIEMGEYDN